MSIDFFLPPRDSSANSMQALAGDYLLGHTKPVQNVPETNEFQELLNDYATNGNVNVKQLAYNLFNDVEMLMKVCENMIPSDQSNPKDFEGNVNFILELIGCVMIFAVADILDDENFDDTFTFQDGQPPRNATSLFDFVSNVVRKRFRQSFITDFFSRKQPNTRRRKNAKEDADKNSVKDSDVKKYKNHFEKCFLQIIPESFPENIHKVLVICTYITKYIPLVTKVFNIDATSHLEPKTKTILSAAHVIINVAMRSGIIWWRRKQIQSQELDVKHKMQQSGEYEYTCNDEKFKIGAKEGNKNHLDLFFQDMLKRNSFTSLKSILFYVSCTLNLSKMISIAKLREWAEKYIFQKPGIEEELEAFVKDIREKFYEQTNVHMSEEHVQCISGGFRLDENNHPVLDGEKLKKCMENIAGTNVGSYEASSWYSGIGVLCSKATEIYCHVWKNCEQSEGTPVEDFGNIWETSDVHDKVVHESVLDYAWQSVVLASTSFVPYVSGSMQALGRSFDQNKMRDFLMPKFKWLYISMYSRRRGNPVVSQPSSMLESSGAISGITLFVLSYFRSEGHKNETDNMKERFVASGIRFVKNKFDDMNEILDTRVKDLTESLEAYTSIFQLTIESLWATLEVVQ
jgi:hypothetical protein